MRYSRFAPSLGRTAPTARTALRASRRIAAGVVILGAALAGVVAAAVAVAVGLAVAATVALLPAHPAVLFALTAAGTVALYALPLVVVRSVRAATRTAA